MQNFFDLIKISTFIDYLIIGFGLYLIFSTLKGTRAAQIVFGLISLYIFKTASLKLDLHNTSKVLSFLFDNLIIFILIIFQEEIRQIVNRISSRWSSIVGKNDKSEFSYQEQIIDAVSKLSKEKTGALIILQGENDLEDHISGGTKLNAEISEELLLTIFENYSPLHDGAVIIQDNKMISAASVLPLSKNKSIDYRFGTRHRAAMGITEVIDCLAIVVSEESGKIRVAEKGKIIELNEDELKFKISTFYRIKDTKINQITKVLNQVSKFIRRLSWKK